jgi:hypothetical protein
MSTPDPELDGVRRPFETALDRLYRARTMQDAEDELSNVLCQLYRLGELCKKRLGVDAFRDRLDSTDDDLRTARAALWARNFNTHQLLALGTTYDPFGRFSPFMYGLAFAPLTQEDKEKQKGTKKPLNRHLDYADFLKGKLVSDTTRRAFDAMAKLL